jgi:gluconolactonase
MKFSLILFFVSVTNCLFSQIIDTTRIERLQPGINKLLAKDAKLEKLPGKYIFTEGPAWNKAGGFIVFSDIPANVIYKYKTGENPSIFLDKSGYTHTDSIFINNPGSNGLVYDKAGNLYICRHGERDVVKMKPDFSIEVIASHYQGKRLNSPNDITVNSKGVVYFTDPPYALKGKNRIQELTFYGVYRTLGGKVELIDSTMFRPNGVTLSPDEKFLYVSSSDNKNKIFKRYKLDKQGYIVSSDILYDATPLPGNGTPDGLKTDKKGNIYGSGPGGLFIISQKGVLLGIIKTSEGVTNVAFGDNDSKTLYITARTSVYKIRTLVAGW